MPAPDSVLKLCETFADHREHFRSGNYNEFQLRKQFLDPLFEALGWDMANSQGLAPQYRDVIHEDAIKIGPHVKAPDYAFTLHGQRKFFLEAKKPSVNIKGDVAPAYQLRRYAWSAKLPLSILSDFEEFAIYDTRIKPAPGDPSSKARVFYCTYDQYAEKWDEIAAIFSRDAILKGSFDKYADSAKKKKGTAEVDTSFLEEIERWRDLLARNFALRNPSLNVRDLNFAVQKTIDRLVFLRICEDRGTEDYGRLRTVANGTQTYPCLLELFRAADARYNSGLFHFSKEKGQAEEPDTLTPNLALDDKVLKDIIAHLYYPDSPYEFSVLPADILGSVYERFLGKTIRLTDGHQAKIEEKPEVRKAGGVYYTPSYIVDYIVENTLGKLLTPEKPIPLAEAAKLKVVDPACGSGSFLIVAYQYLLDWHRDRYAENPEKWSKGKNATLYQAKGGEWRLTTAEKKRILLNNIHGVDIDAAAVEVTKLSLLLKVLEGETGEIAQRDFLKERERILPDLANNIKCGNSLIGSDYYSQPGLPEMDADAHLRINVFDWDGKDGFPEVMKVGGFDAVIGNPPYVDIKGMPEIEVRYLFKKYPCANNRINLFAVFLERTLGLCNRKQFGHSMIVPTALLIQDSYQALRKHIAKEFQIRNVVRLPNESFGASAGAVKVDTAIFVFGNASKQPSDIEVISYSGYDRISAIDPHTAHLVSKIPQVQWATTDDCVWALNVGAIDDQLLKRIEMNSKSLEDFAEICLGLTPYDKYKGHSQDQIKNRVFHADTRKNDTFKPLLAGNDVGRYWLKWNGTDWISYGPWLGAPREKRFFSEKRILVKQIIDWSSKRIWASITEEELYNTQNAFNLLAKPGVATEFLLGLLNSRLMTFYHSKKFLDEFKMRFQKILIKDARRLPIPVIDPANKSDVAAHDSIVALVEKMLDLHRQRTQSKTPHEQTALDRQIAATDRQIDRIVYDLYGLTDEEIALVEGA
jgi:hypothetical protein